MYFVKFALKDAISLDLKVVSRLVSPAMIPGE